ncbi:MAG: YidC/Oxa1 family membrane protein insertase [Lachnospiraceae bacterium]|nr:YidC/Oxa1 family membrane protein insertase [Lachnospiraceae bacterium 28-4]MCI8847610.1 YidC/Oxa1 family membrane protein insertase [Lachnospiraceae bacterium]MCX4375357.1 YidC/Oxa1 family membrane protein insertase [Lachnospiraceae bacterium]
MPGIILTQNQTFIIGPVAKILGYIMEGIFFCLDKIGIPNIGLSIILFTIVIYLLMMPLTVKQQKFSKLSAKMNPELQAIQAKYKNKKDNESMMKMNEETQAVYAKYGVSATGSCVQLLIQMPILFALYRVIYAMPAYVGKIKDAFFPLVDELIAQPGSAEFIQTFKDAAMFTKQFSNEAFTGGNMEYIRNTFIDVLNRASTLEWSSLADKFPSLSADVSMTVETLEKYNNFLGLNIGNSPSFIVKEAVSAGSYLMVVAAIAVPVLSAVTQWINTKLMPQPESNNSQDNTMASSMKTMNYMMPLMSAIFCYTLPAGMGLYWIAGSVVRSIQQVIINKHIDKMDLDELIKKNVEKRNKKLEKSGINPKTINNYANMSTRTIPSKASSMTQEEKDLAVKKSTEYYNKNAKAGSLASKANMVKQYNEKNNKN